MPSDHYYSLKLRKGNVAFKLHKSEFFLIRSVMTMARPALLYLRKDVNMCAEMLSFLLFYLLKSVYA